MAARRRDGVLSAMWAGQKIVAILQEMITDLGTREKMFTSMLAKAEAQVPRVVAVSWGSAVLLHKYSNTKLGQPRMWLPWS
jgi:hypothetical protein